MKMNKITNTQFTKVKSLVKNWCANYDKGKCLPKDMECLQIKCDTGLCNYFHKSVLPLDEKLLMEIVKPKEAITKRCKDCNKIFYTMAKSSQYCEDCARKREKAKYRKYNAKRV